MLTPAYLSGISSEVVDVYAQVEQEIANDIVKRTMKMGYVSDYSKWQMQKAREFGYFQQDVNDILKKAQITAGKDVKQIIAKAAKDSLSVDDAIYRAVGLNPQSISKSPALQALILQGTSNSLQLLSNFTKTTSIEAYSAYQTTLDKAYIKILSGAYSPQTAIHAAIKELASNGMEKVAYQSASGNIHYDNVEVAVRRAITTGVNQSISKLQLARAEEMGCTLVETSWHMGARPTHAVWQGQVFSLDRNSRSSYPDFYDETGYGTGEGLCGWNCYHSFSPFFDGLSTRAWDGEAIDGGNRDSAREYEEQQKQRYYERQIRASRREVATLNTAIEEAEKNGDRALADELRSDFNRASVKLKNREALLKNFLSETGRRADPTRVQTGGWNRSVSGKAAWANKKEIAQKQSTQNTVKKFSPAQGKDISSTWTRRTDKFAFEIEDVINAQGFDGLPRVVSPEEFDRAVRESKFIGQRTYSAPSQEILDSYRDQLYHGKWYVDCSTGGAQYGQGMYLAADYTGKLTDGIISEMKHYSDIGKERLSSPEVLSEAREKFIRSELVKYDGATSYVIASTNGIRITEEQYKLIDEMSNAEYRSAQKIAADIQSRSRDITVNPMSFTETMTLTADAKIITYEDALYERAKYAHELKVAGDMDGFIKAKEMDVGAFAAMKGYDAINAEGHGESGSYTVILNRTKAIIKKDG